MSESLLGASSIRKSTNHPISYECGFISRNSLLGGIWRWFIVLLGSDRNKIYLSVYLGHTLPSLELDLCT